MSVPKSRVREDRADLLGGHTLASARSSAAVDWATDSVFFRGGRRGRGSVRNKSALSCGCGNGGAQGGQLVHTNVLARGWAWWHTESRRRRRGEDGWMPAGTPCGDHGGGEFAEIVYAQCNRISVVGSEEKRIQEMPIGHGLHGRQGELRRWTSTVLWLSRSWWQRGGVTIT